MDKLLQIHNLKVMINHSTILDIPEMEILKGEILVLLGPNGAGKSTLLLELAGLKNQSCGSILFTNSGKISNLEYRRKISTVFQSPLLLNGTVQSNIGCGLQYRGMKKLEVDNRVAIWMDHLYISHLAKRRSNELSGGEAQRVSLARAFCLETDLILMDEPFSALDTPTRQELLDDLRNILAKTGQTCVYVTHEHEEALAIADRVAVMFDGKIHQIDRTKTVFSHPTSPRVAAFMGVENIIPGDVIKQQNDLLQIKVDHTILEAAGDINSGTQVYICIRPEDITLFNINKENQPSTARNHLNCKIIDIANQGPFMRVFLDAGFPLTALITRLSAEEMGLEPGKEVIAGFKVTAIHLISTGKPV
jgi:tungstate transport system ATP-binding protein